MSVTFTDDFGTVMVLPINEKTIAVFEDVRRGLEGGVRRAVLQDEAHVKAQRQANVARAASGIVPAGGGFRA